MMYTYWNSEVWGYGQTLDEAKKEVEKRRGEILFKADNATCYPCDETLVDLISTILEYTKPPFDHDYHG